MRPDPGGLSISLRPAPRDAERPGACGSEIRGRLRSGRNDDHEPLLFPELRGLLLGRDQEVQAEALDGRPAVLGPVPAEPLDPHPRAVGNERRIHCHDSGARLGFGERRGQPVVELPVFRAAGDVVRHLEAPPPGLRPEEGGLLGRGEDALVAARHGGEGATRALRAPPAVTEVAIELGRVPELRACHRGEPQARQEQAPRAHRAPPACHAKPRTVVLQPPQLERIDDDDGSPIAAHGTSLRRSVTPSNRHAGCKPRGERRATILGVNGASRRAGDVSCGSQYLRPLPHGQGSFRPIPAPAAMRPPPRSPAARARRRTLVAEHAWRPGLQPFPSSRRRGMVPSMTNLFSVDGKVALVTGGSRGIGLMIARGFVEAGAKVYISARKAEVCDQVAAELSRQGPCVSLPADCSTEAGARGLADALARREAALHVLVNNAGANWGAPLTEYPDSAWNKVLALNVKGVFHLTRACLPLLERAARPGDPARVINIGSIDGLHVPVLETYAYSASKAAVHHLTRVLPLVLPPAARVHRARGVGECRVGALRRGGARPARRTPPRAARDLRAEPLDHHAPPARAPGHGHARPRLRPGRFQLDLPGALPRAGRRAVGRGCAGRRPAPRTRLLLARERGLRDRRRPPLLRLHLRAAPARRLPPRGPGARPAVHAGRPPPRPPLRPAHRRAPRPGGARRARRACERPGAGPDLRDRRPGRPAGDLRRGLPDPRRAARTPRRVRDPRQPRPLRRRGHRDRRAPPPDPVPRPA